ncbi:TetR/AcrR family transcriptional regulator [Aestuariimicrobium soli]|uniref:TetR/AcrR family transcriptional regulator n=1 Tax=Aestuariimicrobium soli TaxID=2035834 RepID=UPI003EC0CE52
MPRIDAPTVAEHRAIVRERLIDAAEQLLRSGQPEGLTAGAVTKAAGIARNSIYRYVDSVDDLPALVLERHLPAWTRAVDEALAGVTEPGERIRRWVRANIDQAALTGHGWMMNAARTWKVSPAVQPVMDAAHASMRDVVGDAWHELTADEATAQASAALTRGLLESAFRQVDAGADPDLVARVSDRAVRGLLSQT